MDLASKQRGKWTLVYPKDRLSEDYSSRELEKACMELIDSGRKWLAFDLGDVNYVNSSVLRVFIFCQKLLLEQNGGIALLSARQSVREVIEVSGLHKILPVLSSESELPV